MSVGYELGITMGLTVLVAEGSHLAKTFNICSCERRSLASRYSSEHLRYF